MAGMLDCDLCDWRLEGALGCFGGASKAGDGDVDDGSVGCSVAARVCSRLWTMTGGWRRGSDGCLRCAFVRGSGVGDAKDKRIDMLELILAKFVRWL